MRVTRELTGRDDDDAQDGDEPGGFADLVGDVKRVESRPRQRPKTRPHPIASQEGPAAKRVGFRFPDPENAHLGAAHGVSDRVLRELGRGEPPFEETIELHGLDREGARRHLGKNLRSASARSLRCVRVVHGTGRSSPDGAVLRDSLPKWLAKAPCADYALAFAPARRQDGGEGATYVLLRRSV
jgi:DNA-nicking Smr family endonuclease